MDRKYKIYVASSWKNTKQQEVVAALRDEGHQVYDFKNPKEGNSGFSWRQCDPESKNWTPRQYAHILTESPIAAAGFALDKDALDWCDTCVLVLPCGRSAHLEAGYAAGQGKHTIVMLSEEGFEPELMYLLCDAITHSIGDVLVNLRYRKPRCSVTSGWDGVKPHSV